MDQVADFVPDYFNNDQLERLDKLGLIRYPNKSAVVRQREAMTSLVKKKIIPIVNNEFVEQKDLSVAVGVVESLLFSQLPNATFGQFFPEQETFQLFELVYESLSCATPLLIVAPVCPDYKDDGYVLGDSAGVYALSLLDKIPALQSFFNGFGIETKIELDIADTDGQDLLLREMFQLNDQEILRKTAKSRAEIEREIVRHGIQNVEVGSMQQRFTDMKINYSLRQKEKAEQIMNSRSKKVTTAMSALANVRSGEVVKNGFVSDKAFEVSAFELAGYSLYGEMIGGDALIIVSTPMTPHGLSAINFLQNPESVNPTIYFRNKKRMTELFIND